MKYVVDGVEKLDREIECGQCGENIIAICNNDLTPISHVDLFGNTDGDYFSFCANDKCLHSIGVYDFSGSGFDDNMGSLYIDDILQGTFYKDTIINLFESLNVLNNTCINTKVGELKELKDKHSDLQFKHDSLINQCRVDEAVAMVNLMVETNNQIIQIEKSGYTFHVPTKQEIVDVENMIYTLLKYNGVG